MKADCFSCPGRTTDPNTLLRNYCMWKDKQLSVKQLRKGCGKHPRR